MAVYRFALQKGEGEERRTHNDAGWLTIYKYIDPVGPLSAEERRLQKMSMARNARQFLGALGAPARALVF